MKTDTELLLDHLIEIYDSTHESLFVTAQKVPMNKGRAAQMKWVVDSLKKTRGNLDKKLNSLRKANPSE